MDHIDTFNSQMVGMGGGIGPDGQPNIIVMYPKQTMTTEEAILHAAWLLALADPLQERFPAVYEAVCNT